MIVSELVKKLNKVPQDLEVIIGDEAGAVEFPIGKVYRVERSCSTIGPAIIIEGLQVEEEENRDE